MSQQVPVLVLREDTERTRGRDAQRNNIMAAIVIAEAVKSALGPKGQDKMLVDSFGDITVTNDGATILKEMDVAHPAAKMVIEVSKTVDDEVGDGTTTAAVLTGDLLKQRHVLRTRTEVKIADDRSVGLSTELAVFRGVYDLVQARLCDFGSGIEIFDQVFLGDI